MDRAARGGNGATPKGGRLPPGCLLRRSRTGILSRGDLGHPRSRTGQLGVATARLRREGACPPAASCRSLTRSNREQSRTGIDGGNRAIARAREHEQSRTGIDSSTEGLGERSRAKISRQPGSREGASVWRPRISRISRTPDGHPHGSRTAPHIASACKRLLAGPTSPRFRECVSTPMGLPRQVFDAVRDPSRRSSTSADEWCPRDDLAARRSSPMPRIALTPTRLAPRSRSRTGAARHSEAGRRVSPRRHAVRRRKTRLGHRVATASRARSKTIACPHPTPPPRSSSPCLRTTPPRDPTRHGGSHATTTPSPPAST